ncbi:MAG: serine hydrolase domain-containing protein [Rhodothalassiaceae bacterium]
MKTGSACAAIALLCGLFVTWSPAAPAAAETEATIAAYAAGYKAQFICSGLLEGHKSLDQIAAHELTGVYPLIAETLAALPPAGIDRAAHQVRVAYDDAMPPRIAQWRPHLGCVSLPVGAEPADAAKIPGITLAVSTGGTDDNGAPWTTRAPVNGESGNAALDHILDAVFAGGAYGRDAVTSAILVATPEAILAERYIDGFTPTTAQRTWSVAKSLAATVIGAAVGRGLLDVKAPAPVPEWQRPADPRRHIRLTDLLHMSSGLDSNRAGNRTDRLYMGGGLVTDTATRTALEAPPGARWKYANNDTLVAVRALRAAIGDDDAYWRFPFETVLLPLGMTHTTPETDWDGNFILSSQVWTTARDLARLGLLYLNDGVWQGRRILPEGWVDYVATPAPSQPPLRAGRESPGYGAQWWLYNARVPEVPDDAFAARGNRGQYLMVIPSRKLVIVRRGYDPAGGEGFALARFTHDVLVALEGR